jgi:hypothetical protein
VIARHSPTSISLAFLALQSNSYDRGKSPPKEKNMTSTTEQTETPETKATKKAVAGARRVNVASGKGKVGKKATPKKKVPKSARNEAREGSKTATILDLLKRPGGATTKELIKATSWQPHSLRGFLSGALRKKMGLTVASTKGEDGERSFSIKA